MADVTIEVSVRQTIRSKILFRLIILLGKFRLVSLDNAIKLTNHSLNKGAFKYKSEKGKWENLSVGNLEVKGGK